MNSQLVKTLCVMSLFVTSVVLAASCGALKKEAESAGVSLNMKFSGTVKKALETDVGIEGATVRLIQLANADAIKNLIQYKKVPDGEGGTKDVIRLNFEKVHGFAPTFEKTTDANGKWEISDVPLNLYLVYTFGPGSEPGTAGAYGVHFWGINTETGELDEKNLIGVDTKLEQANHEILLAGGPTPPPAPIPELPAVPAAPPEPPTEEVPAEPTAPAASRPEETVAPAADPAFWTSIKLTHKDGVLATGGELAADSIALEEGKAYLEVEGTLAAAQTEPVYLVMQVGFNSRFSAGCSEVSSDAKTVVYPVKANGTAVSYKLVPPGPFYKFFFAKSATKVDDAPVESTMPSDTITVGTRSCENAKPARPFLSNLTWDKDNVDLDIHLIKIDRSLIATSPESSQIDAANWMSPNGTSLSLDVDNVQGFGPESIGEASTERAVNSYCYNVMVNYYAGVGDVNATVDVVHTTTKDGVAEVKQFAETKTLTTPGEWWSVGVFPPECETETAPKTGPLSDEDHSQIAGHYYDTSWGKMVIEYDGTTFKAAYEFREGTVVGSYDATEKKIKGWWCEVSGGNRTDAAGEVEFAFDADVQGMVSLDGQFKSGTDGSWDPNWDLIKITDEPEQALLDRFNDPSAFCTHP